MQQTPFSSVAQFRQAFADGLASLLETPSLGGYILVHANASFEEQMLESLRPRLLASYNLLASRCRQSLRAGQQVEGTEDDVSVFLKLMAIGFEGVRLTRFRVLNDWELQFNHLRAFRPSRMTAEQVSGVSRPFDPTGFHFNKPFLRREAFWAGELLGERVELLYNKFPFVSLHGLLVPDREAQVPQLLSRHYHDYVWRLCESLGERLPGWGVGFNSYGAFASVNHLHFQTFVREAPLPIARSVWRHNGGAKPYPLPCEVYTSASEAWRRIESLHRAACSYNLIYLPGRLYCLPRRSQGSYPGAVWSSGFAWSEVAGAFVTPSQAAFQGLDDEAVAGEMAKLALAAAAQPPSSQSSR